MVLLQAAMASGIFLLIAILAFIILAATAVYTLSKIFKDKSFTRVSSIIISLIIIAFLTRYTLKGTIFM